MAEDMRPAEHFTVTEYRAILGGEDADLALIDGRIWCGDRPFYDVVVDYLAALGGAIVNFGAGVELARVWSDPDWHPDGR
jgi:hypothetical protein